MTLASSLTTRRVPPLVPPAHQPNAWQLAALRTGWPGSALVTERMAARYPELSPREAFAVFEDDRLRWYRTGGFA